MARVEPPVDAGSQEKGVCQSSEKQMRVAALVTLRFRVWNSRLHTGRLPGLLSWCGAAHKTSVAELRVIVDHLAPQQTWQTPENVGGIAHTAMGPLLVLGRYLGYDCARRCSRRQLSWGIH